MPSEPKIRDLWMPMPNMGIQKSPILGSDIVVMIDVHKQK